MKKLYLFAFAVIFVICAHGQSVVISQIYGGGGNTSAPYQNDYIELFNASSSPVAIGNWSIQYAASSGTTWTKSTIPAFTLQPGQYYLYKLGSSGAVGALLPAEDAANTALNISGANGKVALVNNNTTITSGTSCPTGASIVDFVGYGTANCFEGSAASVAGSNTTAIFRALNGCQDLNQNSTDFLSAAPAPRNTSSAFNPCSPTCTTPTQKATNMRYGGSSGNSMTVYFTRGNGKGSLVLCRQGAAVNAAPVNGTVYTASTVFGSGSNVGGTGNYAVFNTTFTGVNAFTVSNLVAGTKYYFSVFEYNDPNKCYTATGLVDSFIVGGTLLKPGDMVFVGWDNSIVSGGDDKIYLMNLVDIAKGTQFSITNSRFESGAAAGTRTNRWYGGSSDPYQDPEKQDFEYVGAGPIAKGSVIAMESSASGFTNFTINGVSVPASDFSAKSGFSNFISNTGTDADQLYITQGRFTSFGTAGVDRYNTYNGLVIHGISIRTPWIALSSSVSSGTTGGSTRQSRIPPDVLCINTEFASSALGYGVYNRSMGTTGTKNQILSAMKNPANWNMGAGSNTADDAIAAQPNINNPYTINSPVEDGVWQGGSTDWFDCSNWEGLHVPDSTTVAYVYGVPDKPNYTIISTTSANGNQYQYIARAGSLNVMTNGKLSLTGAGKEKLVVENGTTLQTGATLEFESNANATGDTLWVHDFISDNEPSNASAGLQPGWGTVVLDEARTNTSSYSIDKAAPAAINFYNLCMSNTRSTSIARNVNVNNNLNLLNGYINISAPNGLLRLGAAATISSPANVYGQSNKGYFNSFVNGRMYYDANAASVNMAFPIGKYSLTDTLFAPVELTKTNTSACTYDAEYFPAAYSDLAVDISQLHHVSSREYWLINSTAANADAKVTLSWRPMSQVGDGSNNPVAFDSLMVSHYVDDDGIGPNPYRWHVDGGSNVIMPKNPGYNFNYGLVTTVVATSVFSPFTLGTRGPYSILPVRILDFSAVLKNSIVKLEWITEAENLVAGYVIEKSVDGIHFTDLATVNPVNSVNRFVYAAYDFKPVAGLNFYRLRIVDKTGKAEYSAVKRIWVGKDVDFQVVPNPASNVLQINLPAASSISYLTIVNASGEVVKQLATSDRTITLNIEFLSKGVYFLKLLSDRQTITQRFIKL